jgi:hypothetical protein
VPTVTLQHCVAVRVYATDEDPPPDVGVDVDSGGSATDGIVQVKANGPDGPIVGGVPCGIHKLVPAVAPKEIWLHYMKTLTGPEETEVTYQVSM